MRRTVVRRRRRRAALGGAATAVVAAVALTLTLTSGGGGRPAVHMVAGPGVRVGARIDGAVQLVSDSHAVAPRGGPVAQVVEAQQELAITLLQQLGTHNGRNVSVSPESLQLALGMLQNGARGATARQIATALQSSGLSTTQQDAGLAALTAELSTAARGHVRLDTANSLWQQQGFRLEPAFLTAIAKYYDAGVWQTDFQTSQGLDAINHWTDTNTNGKIPKLFDNLDPSTVLVLADALYLHADWQSPFEKAETTTGRFTTGAGTHVTAHFMSGTTADGVQAPTYDAAQLPYRGGRFAAQVIMPTKASLADFVARLSPARLSAVTASLRSTHTGIALPRFTTRTNANLKPVLRRLGMRRAFTPAADLSGLSRQSTDVDQVVQRVYLHVDEKGTTSAAATGAAIIASSGVATPLTFDHPFLFLVRDTRTGAVLFASEVDDPTAG